MNDSKRYKWLLYGLLIFVIILTFAFTSIILNQITNGNISPFNIVFIIINVIVNFALLFMTFRFRMIISDKEAQIVELENSINKKEQTEEVHVEDYNAKEVNIEELIDMILPKNLQGLNAGEFAEKILANTAKALDIVQGIFYLKEPETNEFKPIGKYACFSDEEPKSFSEGETIA